MGSEQTVTVPKFVAMKAARQKITMVTAYDYVTASLLDAAGIEGILVGDSLGMAFRDTRTRWPVTLDQMIYHAEIVGRAVQHALVVVDLPFPSYRLGVHNAIANAGRILKETQVRR